MRAAPVRAANEFPTAVRSQLPGEAVVLKACFDRGPNGFSCCVITNRYQDLDSTVKVAFHEVGRPDQHVLSAGTIAVREVVDA